MCDCLYLVSWTYLDLEKDSSTLKIEREGGIVCVCVCMFLRKRETLIINLRTISKNVDRRIMSFKCVLCFDT